MDDMVQTRPSNFKAAVKPAEPGQASVCSIEEATQIWTEQIICHLPHRYRTRYACLISIVCGIIWMLVTQHHKNRYESITHVNAQNYFAEFQGFAECNIRGPELYLTPTADDHGFYEAGTFCRDRKQLLQALSDGGRIGFDAPYQSRGR